jgi:steroid 5-alpha reductase family enzyme
MNTNPWLNLLLAWLPVAVAMGAGWYWQQRRRNAGIVDVLWSAGLAFSAVRFAALGSGAAAPRLMLAVLGGLWGLRLAWHLWRRVRGEGEDGRYRQLRARWGDGGWRWFAFFQFQALLVALFALPFLAVAGNPRVQPGWLLAGALVWLIAVGGEAVADAQLARFRADPAHRGRTCRVGLWRYSRHPNYFFEWLHWFAYVALAQGAPLAWLAWTGPVLMFVFLRWLSGIPWTEAQALRTRGEDYRDYQRRTPMLFPWFPKRSPTTRSGS